MDGSDIKRQFGLWYYQSWAYVNTTEGTFIVKTCQIYPDDVSPDASWKAARAFSSLTLVFAIIIIIVKTCMSCSSDHRQMGVINSKISILYLLTALFQGLTLLSLNSELCTSNSRSTWNDIQWSDTCSIDTGAKCIISAMVFWFAAAFSSFLEQKALKEEENELDALADH